MSALKAAIARLAEGQRPGAELTCQSLLEAMHSDTPPALTAAWLMGMRVLGETEEEMLGAARAVRAAARTVAPRRTPLVDTCGTGGDGAGSLNISTLAAFVVAAGGGAVVKHGNRSVSSLCGSADLIEALGVPLHDDPQRVARCVEEVGFGFLFAPYFHPAMAQVAPVRRSLGIRTLFNLIGPLSNPAQAEYQLIGVFHPRWLEPMARTALRLGVKACLVVHGHAGVDELTLTGPAQAIWAQDGDLREFTIDPLTLGLDRVGPEAVAGGGPAENAVLSRAILEGQRGPAADTVALNAGAALWVADLAPDLRSGLEQARGLLARGAPAEILDRVRGWSG